MLIHVKCQSGCVSNFECIKSKNKMPFRPVFTDCDSSVFIKIMFVSKRSIW